MSASNEVGTEQFSTVLGNELAVIGNARAAALESSDAPRSSGAYQRAREMRLKGLALSGGGIRSATFNLGFIQALCEAKVLRRFDYLSTVSGGGYIGGWLSAVIHHQSGQKRKIEDVEAALSPTGAQGSPKAEEDRSIGFLRAYSNYLTPKVGLLSTDTLAGIAAYLRNLVLVQTTIIALLLAVLLVPRLVFPLATLLQAPACWGVSYAAWGAVVLLAISVIGIGLNLRADKTAFRARTTFVLLVVIVPAVLGALCLSVELADPRGVTADWEIGAWAAVLALFYGALSVLVASWPAGKDAKADADSRSLKARVRSALHGAAFGTPRWLLIVVTGIAAGAAGGVGLYFVHELLEAMAEHLGASAAMWFAISLCPFLLLYLFSLMIIYHLGLIGRIFDYQVHEWWSRYGAWIMAMSVGVGGVFTLAVYGPALVDYGWAWVVYLGGPVWILTTLWGVSKGASSSTSGTPAADGKPKVWTERFLSAAPYVFIFGLTLALSYGIHRLLTPDPEIGAQAYEKACKPESTAIPAAAPACPWEACKPAVPVAEKPCPKGTVARASEQMASTFSLCIAPFAFAAFVALWGLLARRVDINLFSFHNFYRNRLTRCYLGAARIGLPASKEPGQPGPRQPHPFTGFDSNDDIALDQLADKQPGTAQRPYHILNTALNMSTGRELAWQQRKATAFFFSPLYCGFQLPATASSQREGRFIETHQYMRAGRAPLGPSRDAGPMLGSVVAVSGAAASPNWGFHTSTAVAFLLTLFNVRLGRWCPNPAYKPRPPRRSSPGFGGWLLLQELFGQTDSRSKYVYLSDGGHFDNLGIYELVRRRTSLIVVCDCGQDTGRKMDDLADTMRKCASDFGVQIRVDVEPLKALTTAGSERFAGAYAVHGKIAYPALPGIDGDGAEPFEGDLFLVKPTLTEEVFKAAADVRNYALTNEMFPQQTTADQWFDEAQFESYRSLGCQLGRWVLDREFENTGGMKLHKLLSGDTKPQGLPAG